MAANAGTHQEANANARPTVARRTAVTAADQMPTADRTVNARSKPTPGRHLQGGAPPQQRPPTVATAARPRSEAKAGPTTGCLGDATHVATVRTPEVLGEAVVRAHSESSGRPVSMTARAARKNDAAWRKQKQPEPSTSAPPTSTATKAAAAATTTAERAHVSVPHGARVKACAPLDATLCLAQLFKVEDVKSPIRVAPELRWAAGPRRRTQQSWGADGSYQCVEVEAVLRGRSASEYTGRWRRGVGTKLSKNWKWRRLARRCHKR